MRKITEEQYHALNKIIEFYDELSWHAHARRLTEGTGDYFPAEQKIINSSLSGEDWAEKIEENKKCFHICEDGHPVKLGEICPSCKEKIEEHEHELDDINNKIAFLASKTAEVFRKIENIESNIKKVANCWHSWGIDSDADGHETVKCRLCGKVED